MFGLKPMITDHGNVDISRLRDEYALRQQRSAADTYALYNPAQLFARQQRERKIVKLLHRRGFMPLGKRSAILELGCGSGSVLAEYQSWGAASHHLHGIDLLPYRLNEAKAQLPLAWLECADGQQLPYPSCTFDLVLQSTAFSSILEDSVKVNMAREMLRVLRRPNGLIIWYDFWLNPTNPQTRGIRPNEIRRLFPHCHYEFQRITLAPPITRRLVPRSWLAGMVLEKLTLFNTHYLVAIQPRS